MRATTLSSVLVLAACLAGSAGATSAAIFALAGDEPGASGARPSGCTLVVAVRHAEKETEGTDPGLSEQGRARARALADALAKARVDTILVSPTRRSRDTAAPLAERAGVVPQAVPLDGGIEAHVAALARAVRAKPGGSVVVVGHANTVPAMLQALGVEAGGDLAEDAYGDLFEAVLCEGSAPRLVRGSYGGR